MAVKTFVTGQTVPLILTKVPGVMFLVPET